MKLIEIQIMIPAKKLQWVEVIKNSLKNTLLADGSNGNPQLKDHGIIFSEFKSRNPQLITS